MIRSAAFILTAALVGSLLVSACETPPQDSGGRGVVADGTRLEMTTSPFGFLVIRDGRLVGGSGNKATCPALTLAIRADSDTGGFVDVTRPATLSAFTRLTSTTARVLGNVAEVDLVNDRGELGATAQVTATVGAEGFIKVDVSFQRGAGAVRDVDVAYVSACFALRPDEHLVGGGERFDGPDLKGKLTPLVFAAPGNTQSGTNEAHVPVPFFATTSGFSVLVETERVGAFDALTVDDAVEARFLGTELPLRFRAARGTRHPATGGNADDDAAPSVQFEHISDNVAAFARLMGLPKAPPQWALAPMQWRNDLEVQQDPDGTITSTGTDMLLGDVDALTERGLPFSSIWIDAPWETGYNTFVVNETQLPNFDAAVASLTDHGLVPLVWATEHVNLSDDSDQMVGMPAFASKDLFDDFKAAGFLVSTANGDPFTFPWGRGQGAFVDFTNPEACAAFQVRIRRILQRGVHGFKLDYGESMRADLLGLLENTLPVFADGSTTRVQHTRYARLYHECYIGALQQVHDDDWFIITRTGGLYDQKNGVAIWPGDLDSDFSRLGDLEGDERRVGGLKSGIGGGLSLAMSGYPLYGHDVGGYRGGEVTPEAFARWAEAGALQTIMQVGGGSNQAAWDDFLLDVEDAFAKATRLKMDLWPMYEAAIARASAGGDGTPVVLPLGVAMGEDADAWADPDAMVLFDRLAAFLVVEGGARERSVRLPKGQWVNYWHGDVVDGETTFTSPAPLGEPPLFVRAGTSLVLDRESQSLLPTTIPGRLGPSTAREVLSSPGGFSQTTAGGLSVQQQTSGTTTTTTTITVDGAVDTLTLRVAGRFAEVDVQGATVDDQADDDGFTVVTLSAPGRVVARFTR